MFNYNPVAIQTEAQEPLVSQCVNKVSSLQLKHSLIRFAINIHLKINKPIRDVSNLGVKHTQKLPKNKPSHRALS